MQHLIRGLHHFQKHIFRPHRELFERLAEGQRPDTLFITCSDSRVNPNLVTQTGPGELFILRNAGNLIPHAPAGGGSAATVEYAVAALEVRDIILCGHSHCGAVNAILHPETVEQMPLMRSWLQHAEQTRRLVQENYSHLEGNALLTAAVEENVLVQLENLRSHEAVAEALDAGRLRVHGWVYKIETGEMFAYDPEAEAFLPLNVPLVVEPTASPFNHHLEPGP